MKKFFAVVMILVFSTVSVAAFAISDEKKSSVVNNCDSIKTNITNLQHADSRARVYLGRYYETILNKFIVPLNLRLVENNISNSELMDNQTNFAAARQDFINDYITYQQGLEELAATNCKENPEGFYEKLIQARAKQKNVSNDVIKLRNLVTREIDLVKKLKETLK